jgi:hypothetical protein
VRKVLFDPFRFPVGFNRHQEVDCKGANQIAPEFRVVQRYNRIESSAPQSSGPRSGFGQLRQTTLAQQPSDSNGSILQPYVRGVAQLNWVRRSPDCFSRSFEFATRLNMLPDH